MCVRERDNMLAKARVEFDWLECACCSVPYAAGETSERDGEREWGGGGLGGAGGGGGRDARGGCSYPYVDNLLSKYLQFLNLVRAKLLHRTIFISNVKVNV